MREKVHCLVKFYHKKKKVDLSNETDTSGQLKQKAKSICIANGKIKSKNETEKKNMFVLRAPHVTCSANEKEKTKKSSNIVRNELSEKVSIES